MKSIKRNEQAQAGVGTLIIFIAMVLVAAVAAAVLIQTSGVMQSKSTSTTKEAAAAISENLVVEAVDGVSDSSAALNVVNITIRIAAGGSDLDLSKVLVKVKAQSYAYSNGSLTSNYFRVVPLRDPDNGTLGTVGSAVGSSNPVLKPGAIIRLDVNVSGTSLTSRSPVTFGLTPEKGTTYNLPLTLPAIGPSTIVAIYP